MITVNRIPNLVNIPSNSDTKHYFFNHYNWKGVNDDKNYVTLDPETFANSKNVYMDKEGLLRSRPSLKTINDLKNIVNFWTFDNIIVYLIKSTYTSGELVGTDYYYLLFTKSDGTILLNLKNDLGDNYHYTNTNIKLIKIEHRIFVFSATSFRYFEEGNPCVFADATSFIYIPETTSYSFLGESKNLETKNLLTNSEIITYLYSHGLGVSNEAYNKNVKVDIQGNTYEIYFTSFTPTVLSDLKFKTYGKTIVSDNNTAAYYNSSTCQVFYSPNCVSFVSKGVIPEELPDNVVIKFTRDNNHIVITTGYSLYIVSVNATENEGTSYKYENITDLYYSNSYVKFLLHTDYYYTHYIADFVTADNFVLGLRSDTSIQIFRYSNNAVKMELLSTDDDVDKYVTDLHYINSEGSLKIGTDTANSTLTSFDVLIIYSIAKDKPNIIAYDSTITSVVVDPIPISIALGIRGANISVRFVNGILTLAYPVYSLTALSNKYDTVRIVTFTDSFINNYYYIIKDFNDNRVNLSNTIPVYLNTISTKLLTGFNVYDILNSVSSELINSSNAIPIAYTNYIYYLPKSNSIEVYSTNVDTVFALKYTKMGSINYIVPYLFNQLEDMYISIGQNLYISELKKIDNAIKLYFPYSNNIKFNYNINAICPLSISQMGVFLNNEIWYVTYDNEVKSYYSIKSKLEVGVRENADLITSYDGSNLLFACERGLVSMKYQDFVASTDQVIDCLSDTVFGLFKDLSTKPIKMQRHQYWVICYAKGKSNCLIYDIRNKSWWPMDLNIPIDNVQTTLDIISSEDTVYTLRILSNGIVYKLSTDDEEYYDYINNTKINIDWEFRSQKLHLKEINKYKHIVNITLMSVLDTTKSFHFILDITNFRKISNNVLEQHIEYTVDSIRTFVQRLNFSKVEEFQYKLSSDYQAKIHVPLSLSNITIKYKITGEVR